MYVCISSFLLLVSVDKPDLETLEPYFRRAVDWKLLGFKLLPKKYRYVVNDIDASKREVKDCKLELLLAYFRVGEVSWDKVIDALENSGNDDIAKDIKEDKNIK